MSGRASAPRQRKIMANSILSIILGRRLASREQTTEKIGVLTGVSALGLDGLSSSAYGPEAALMLLLPLGAAGLNCIGPITLAILILLAMLYFSYRQTIAAYPINGGSYTVAKENLGTWASLLAAAALMIDYVLTVAVGISAGVGALVSAAPHLHKFTLPICLTILALITILNLRGTGEAGLAFALPTYLFIASLGSVLVLGIFRAMLGGGHPRAIVAPPPLPAAIEPFSAWLVLRSFASGCTAMTGVEAVSNGVSAFKEPMVKNAHRTLTVIVLILAFLLGAIAYLSRAYHVGAMDQSHSGYQSVLSQLALAVVGRGWAYYLTIGAVLTVLCLSANTSFVDFPRVCGLIAKDSFLPRAFAAKGRRLVYSMGILCLAAGAGVLLAVFGGITDRLIPLYAVGAFLAFTLSQLGMVMHWRKQRGEASGQSPDAAEPVRRSHGLLNVRLAVNAVGAAATAGALAIILAAKFIEGAWITILAIPLMITMFWMIHRRYQFIDRELGSGGPLDLSHNQPPVVVLPTRGWNRITAKALRFAVHLSGDVIAVHLSNLEGDAAKGEAAEVRQQWQINVENPARAAGIPPPRLVIAPTPYREFIEPLLQQIDRVRQQFPDRVVVVIIGEIIEPHWWQGFLHSRRAARLRAVLHDRGDAHIVVMELPWYLSDVPDANAPRGV
jgi:amino acid transporter